jgi:hypothetical protein
MNTLQRLLDTFRRPVSSGKQALAISDFQSLRCAMLDSVDDCRDSGFGLRLHTRIAHATSAQQLWLLRSDAHDVIARHHCQTIAAERIRHLERVREG